MVANSAQLTRDKLFDSLFLLDDYPSCHHRHGKGYVQRISCDNLAILAERHPEWSRNPYIPTLSVYDKSDDTDHLAVMRYFLALEKDPQLKQAIHHSFEMSFGVVKNQQRCNEFLLAFEENEPDKPVAFICFNYSLMDSWETMGNPSGTEEFGLCCHLIFGYVMPTWRTLGLGHCLADVMTRRFANQVKHIGGLLKGTQYEVTPLIYEGLYAKGAEHLLQHCEQDLQLYLKQQQQELPFHASISNV